MRRIITLLTLSLIIRSQKLKTPNNTEAIILNKGKGTYVDVEYTVDKKLFKSKLHCNCPELEEGDTILIKYSLEDPSTIALEKKFYMQKYKQWNEINFTLKLVVILA